MRIFCVALVLVVVVAALCSAAAAHSARSPHLRARLRELLADTTRDATPLHATPELLQKIESAGFPPAEFEWANCAPKIAPDEGECGTGTVSMTLANVISGVDCVSNNAPALNYVSAGMLTECNSGSYGCDGAMPSTMIQTLLNQTNGLIATNESYPFTDGTGTDGNCKRRGWRVATAVRSFVALTKHNEDALLRTVWKTGPAAIVIDPTSLETYQAGTIISGSRQCKFNYYEHMLTVVGWGERNGTKYWKTLNSWGDYPKGSNGFVFVERGVNCMGLAGQPSTVTVVHDPYKH